MSKENFDTIYSEPDPRAYYATLGALGYEIPAHSATLFGQLAGIVGDGRPAKVVDLCCSYGVNSAPLKYDVSFDEVLAHYTDPEVGDLDREELIARDRAWLAERPRAEAPIMVGVDVSAPAIEYACDAGLLDVGIVEDLEAAEPSDALAAELSDADLISVSGGIGYITERTIDHVLKRAERPWLAALCLRWVDFAPIVDTASRHQLVTERLDDATFPQRRFVDDAERDYVLSELETMGIDPDGREGQGWHHTDFYLLRPDEDAHAAPLAELVVPEGAVRSPDADQPVPWSHGPKSSSTVPGPMPSSSSVP